MVRDFRHAVRSILRMPALSAIVVVSLGFGIGINTVVFSWIQSRLLNPVPGVTDGADLLLIEPKTETAMYPGASWPEFEDIQRSTQSFDGLIAARMTPLYVGPAGAVERVFGLLVSDNYFSALGVRPAIGRFFLPEEVTQGGSAVAVISYRLWQTRFGGSRDVLAKTLRINARELTVIGVTPDEFQGTHVGLQFDTWLPATLAPVVANGSKEMQDRRVRGYSLIGRLRPSVTRRQAQGEIDTVMRQLAQSYPATNATMTAEVLPFSQSPRGPQRMLNAALAVLQAIMLLLLLAVCGNVANLMLARASARQREMGIRLALGARPWRIASLLLTENVVLALLGAGLGAAFAVWGTQGLLVLPLTGLPVRFQTSIDGLGLTFAIGLGLACGLLFGAAPAAQLARIDPQLAYRAGIASAGRSRLRHTLMAAQVALAMMVLIVAGLFFRSVMETREIDPGFRVEGALLAAYDLSGRETGVGFSRELAARTIDALRAQPSVESAAIASSVPLDIHGMPVWDIRVDGHARADGLLDEALANTVTPQYFEVMGIPMLSGRGLAPLTDAQAPRQAVVNEAFVRLYIGDAEAVGRQVHVRDRPYVITGVVGNSLFNAFGEAPQPAIYFSYRDLPQPRGEIHVRLREGAAPARSLDIRRVMREVDADLPVFNVRSMAQHVETNLIFRTVPARMFSVLGPLLLLLAAIGIYGVVAYSVSLRTREIGVRLALGATARQVLRQLVGESVGVAALGGLIGWSLAFLFASLLAPGGRIDAVVFVIVPGILLVVAGIASWLPARRALAVDAAAALRSD
jgi:predicted permease